MGRDESCIRFRVRVCALYVDSEMKASRERSIQITYCKLLLEARLVHDRNYSSIPKYPELVKMCGYRQGSTGHCSGSLTK
jgi:hypothetical protein